MSSHKRRGSVDTTFSQLLLSRASSSSKELAKSESEHDFGHEHAEAGKTVNCISCQRKGKRSTAAFYCQDCKVGLCIKCTEEHREIRLNRHSISTISKTYAISPNQGPFPELTAIGTIKMDDELFLRGSTFLPNGELVTADFINAKIRVYSADYTRKAIANFLIPKDHNWELKRPKPFDLAAISNASFAFTAANGCIYIMKMGNTRIINIERMIKVIDFDSNFGECLGLTFNENDKYLYVGCSSDREGVFIKVYDLEGEHKKTVRDGILEAPDYLTFSANKSKLYSADSDSVTVYDVRSFEQVEKYPELQAQIKDIFIDKYGYTYCLALERRTYNSAGSIYRLDIDRGVTKVTELDDKPASISYSPKTDTVAVTFAKSSGYGMEPTKAIVRRIVDIKDETPCWMSKLPEKLWDLPLNHLAIPGSHDSFSYTRDKDSDVDRNMDPFYKHFVDHFDAMANEISYRWSVTQTKSLREQLDLGVRYFDMRFTARADDHHVYYRNGANVLYALKEFKDWLAEHKREVIIIDFREMHQVSESQHKKLLSETTRETFVDKLIEYTGNMQSVTLRNMWGIGAQVIVIYPNEHIYRFSSMWPSDNVIKYIFPDAQTTEQLITSLDMHYEQERKPNVFCCYQGVLTPNKQFLYLNLEKSLKTSMSVPATCAVANWVQGKFIREMKLNIVLADHVDLFDFCVEVIRSNYGSRMMEKYDFEKSNSCTII